MSNIFELCPTHFSRGEEKIVGVFAHPGYWLGQSRDREAPDTLSASAQFGLFNFNLFVYEQTRSP